MDKNRVVEITNELYRLTLLFPKKEPLRFQMRELADEILAYFVVYFSPDSDIEDSVIVKNRSSQLEALDSFFEVAKAQSWVKKDDILKLQEEYRRIIQELKEPRQQERQLSFAKATEGQREKEEIVEQEVLPVQLTQGLDSPLLPETSDLEQSRTEVSDRQKRILDILKQKEGVQVWEVKDVFPDVSKRTLRRDFKKLLNDGLVERKGERNTTFYKLKMDRTI